MTNNKNNQYNVVTGWHRSGTSALMTALREAGIPILGFKYPYRFSFDFIYKGEKQKTALRDGGILEPLDEVRAVNPTGYWEVPSICLEKGLQKEHLNFDFPNGNLVKVPFGVLPMSDPTLIDKVIVILRDPAKTIASEMKNKNPKDKEAFIRAASLALIHNAVMSWRWAKKHSKKTYLLTYEDLLDNPQKTLGYLCAFLGRGNPECGVKVVHQHLDRSTPVASNSKQFEVVQCFYDDLPKSLNKPYNLKRLRKDIKALDTGGLFVEFSKLQ